MAGVCGVREGTRRSLGDEAPVLGRSRCGEHPLLWDCSWSASQDRTGHIEAGTQALVGGLGRSCFLPNPCSSCWALSWVVKPCGLLNLLP